MTRIVSPKIIFPLLFAFASVLFFHPAFADKKKKVKPPPEISIYDIDTLKAPIPRQRVLFHEHVAKQLKRAEATDGIPGDNFIWIGEDTTASLVMTQAILHDAAHLDTMIENLTFTDKQTENQTKIGYLRDLTDLLVRFNNDNQADPYFYKKLVANWRGLLIARYENRLMNFVRANANIYTMNNAKLLEGYPEARTLVYSSVGRDDPKMMIRRLPEFANEPYADSIIIAAARVVPNEIYTFASSTNYTISNAIRRTDDPLVQSIVKITKESKSPLKAMSFLNDIYTGNKTIAEIDKITADPDLYYKNLVRLKMEGSALGGDTYTEDLQFRGLKYVRTINELHEENNLAIRFKCLDGFTPEELYFMMVYGADEIYTSSFLGAFSRMMERLKPRPGDELLASVKYDHFRTFLRMSANYNVLDGFLATMQPEKKTVLMKSFISDLEKGKEYDLEDAVDVADAYGSVSDTVLRDFLRQEVLSNYQRVSDAHSNKGLIVYGLLSIIFNGGAIDDVSQKLKLPPINLVPYKSLAGDNGIVFERFFFYGDEDGKQSFASFLTNFKDGKWKITEGGKYWMSIASTSGNPVRVYATKPVEGEGEDDKAQQVLTNYLDSLQIHPTIIVHRGHSYHLSSTVDQLQKPARIVMLGSCGGYHNLGAVLDHSPDAQIISTKQTGSMSVNEPIVKAINNQLLAGKDIDWIETWRSLDAELKPKGGKPYEYFLEYVPPHRNLGAIFIKAYRRISNMQATM